jgi:hypothetical protein
VEEIRDQHDRESEPIIDWSAVMKRFKHEANIEFTLSVIQRE